MNPSILRTAAGLAGLAGVALLAEPLSGLADTAVAGHMGVAEQGALALGAGVITTTTWLLSPLMFAQTTEIARLRVQDDVPGVHSAVRRSVVLAGIWGSVLAAVIVLFAVTAVDDADARGYLLVRAVGLPVSAVVLAGYGALRGGGWVRDVTALASMGAAVHIAIVVVVAWAGLGVVGIGTASGVSQFFVALACLRVAMRRGLWSTFRSHPDPDDDGAGAGAWRSSIVAVILLAVRSSMLGGATLTMTIAAVHSGPVEAAAHLVAYQVWLLAVLAVEGWKSAAQILVSSAPSADRRRDVERSVLGGSIFLGVIAAFVVFAIRPVAVSSLSASDGVASVASSIWWLSALSFVVGAVAFTRDGVEFGRGAFGGNIVRVALGTVVTVAGALMTYASGDLAWMWIGMPLGLLVRAVWPYKRDAAASKNYLSVS